MSKFQIRWSAMHRTKGFKRSIQKCEENHHVVPPRCLPFALGSAEPRYEMILEPKIPKLPLRHSAIVRV